MPRTKITSLLLNFNSFASFSYKISLIKCLRDSLFKICSKHNSFHNDIESIKSKFSSSQNQVKGISDVHYFKLPYICNLSHHIKNKLLKLCKEFCKENFNIKLVFNSFKIKNYFSYKDPIPDDLKSFLVYKYTCASCSSSYIGKTCHHFETRIEEHIKRVTSLIF